jgi:hypothetical protein
MHGNLPDLQVGTGVAGMPPPLRPGARNISSTAVVIRPGSSMRACLWAWIGQQAQGAQADRRYRRLVTGEKQGHR